MKDTLSIGRANKLHPKYRQSFIDFIDACEKETGLTFRIVQGLRTIQEQNDLYAIGRTKDVDKPVVTRAKGGQSFHNYGLAIDIVPIVNGKADWDFDFNNLLHIATAFGFTWGGAWKDFDHYEQNLRHGPSGWKYFLDLHNSGKVDKEGYVLI